MAYPKGKPKSEESKRKAREAMLQFHAENPEARRKQAASEGRRHSAETRRKMSEARTAYWAARGGMSPEERTRVSEGRKGKGTAKRRPWTPEERARISEGRKGKLTGRDHHQWKGDAVSYEALHAWVRLHFGSTGCCEMCGQRRKTQWANVSGNYERERGDWQELCSPCHKHTDLGHLRVQRTLWVWERPDGSLCL